MNGTPEDDFTLFEGLWKGGYYEGDPEDRVAKSTYNVLSFGMGYLSVLHAVYLACIKPYINNKTVALEIGPGKGAWTKTMLKARELWCLDVLSAEETHFWEHIGEIHKESVKYIQVDDFSCSCLPEDHIDYFFSWAAFCHITWDGQKEYYKNLYPKLKEGSHAFVMFADLDKINYAVTQIDNWRVRPLTGNPIIASIMESLRQIRHKIRNYKLPYWDKNDKEIRRGRAYHVDHNELCTYLESIGYKVLTSDMGFSPYHCIVHFVKPKKGY